MRFRFVNLILAASLGVHILALAAMPHGAVADDDSERSLELFEKHVRPLLLDQCIRCHGPEKQQGGLRLDSAKWLRKGGDSGPILSPGDPDESLLIRAVRYKDPALEMPPRGRLPDTTIAALEDWVALGGVDPRVADDPAASTKDNAPTIQAGKQFWSFQPIQDPPLPPVHRSDWPVTSIDHFILARMEQAGLHPARPADRPTLIRRVYYDLIGLPPTPAQVTQFANDDSPTAYADLIDRLLDSPEFGQRWGRHWLDVVRFAQSSGGGRTLLFPNAWRYRDYVIDSFNNDLPYDQFVREQIAGDLLEHTHWQDKRRKLTATAYLLLGPTNYELQDKDILEMDVVDEQIDTIGKSMLGMTIGCARCHDHKFDPIPTEDYYALAGILKSTKAMIHSNVSTWNKVTLPVSPDEESLLQEHEQSLVVLRNQIKVAKSALKKLGGRPKNTRNNSEFRDIDSQTIDGIVVDDVDAELIGQWTPSTSAPRYVDGKYIHDGTADKGKKQAIFRPQIPEAGNYEIWIGYSPFGNRSTRVPVHIHHATGESVVLINQKQKPEIDDAFTSVGVFALDPERDVRIVISNEGTEDGVVIADSVVVISSDIAALPTPDQVDIPANIALIVPDPRTLDGIVVDDTQATLAGDWKHSVHTPPFVGASYLHDEKLGKGEKSATFTPDLPSSGVYEVRVSHNTNVRRANDVPITIRHADGETIVRINQGEEAPIEKLFRSLGEFRFEAGQGGAVTIGTDGTEGKYVIVDAVQFLPVEDIATEKRRREELAQRIATLESELAQAEKRGPQRPIAMVTADDDDAGDIHVAIRGVVHNPGPLVKRGVLQVAATDPRPEIPAGESGRRELAQWIADADNPLTARVMTNRIWYWLVGRGIVTSVDNFGSTGSAPTHPELLDHLATQFVQDGWSVKKLIRRILLSSVYQSSSAHDPEQAVIDPENKLLWRMNRKRLRAEDIRDTLLFVSGSLDETFGGPNVSEGTKSEYGYRFTSSRRSVYVPVFRNTLPEVFEVFDFADPNIQRGSRTSSTIASQALLLMNHPFVIDQCEKAAEQLLQIDPFSTSSAIEQAYLQVIGRSPTVEEIEIVAPFLDEVSDPTEKVSRWALIFQTLFECVDFRYLN
ncbi:MAG: DUF1553 domain-containing protein [Pirellulaceae bacterium]|nr:DUF1553 domain-containing protein [Pirellulaceae bacterium]